MYKRPVSYIVTIKGEIRMLRKINHTKMGSSNLGWLQKYFSLFFRTVLQSREY